MMKYLNVNRFKYLLKVVEISFLWKLKIYERKLDKIENKNIGIVLLVINQLINYLVLIKIQCYLMIVHVNLGEEFSNTFISLTSLLILIFIKL